MKISCTHCRAHYQVTEEDRAFYDRVSPVYGGRKFQLPPPTLCPDCRFQRRAVWRNEFRYYPRTCSLCGHRSISVHSEEKPYPVVCNRCWWSDGLDLRQFGLEMDLSRSFFDQFAELQRLCPRPFMANDNHTASENIEYCQGTAYSKNCYLVSTSWRLQDCLYCSNCGESRDLVDCRFVGDGSELLYESATCQRTYGSTFLYGCSGCSDCHFGIDLRGCSDCVGCIGLSNKRFHIFNTPYSPAEFKAEVEKLRLDSFSGQQLTKERFASFTAEQPQRGVIQVNCERVSGNNLFNCKNFVGFNVWGGEDCKHYSIGTRPKNCHDILVGGEHEWCYEGVNPDHSYQCLFTVWCWSCTDVHYSDNCHSSKNLFGCIGLRGQAEYCILNRQYSREEYLRTVAALIDGMAGRGEWGEFFPIAVSPFAYNETVAQDYFPITPVEAGQRGFSWADKKRNARGRQQAALPDRIADVSEGILREVLCCTACAGNFKIMPLELAFYRKMKLPLPRNCPDCRRRDRFARTGSFQVWRVSCSQCGKETESAAPESAGKQVLCAGCYAGNQEV